MSSTRQVVLCNPVRTAIGTYGGSLKDMSAPDLGAVAIRETLKRSGLASDKIQTLVMGNVILAAVKMNPARQAGIAAGPPLEVPALRQALARAGWSVAPVDRVETNEAFAAIALACLREFGSAEAIVNVEGDAIARGHPVAASGAVLATRLMHSGEARRLQARHRHAVYRRWAGHRAGTRDDVSRARRTGPGSNNVNRP